MTSLLEPAHSSRGTAWRTAWRTWHRPLLICAALMAGLMFLCAVGTAVDSRTLLGESVWVKPMKFGFAFALYTGTLALVPVLTFGVLVITIAQLIAATAVLIQHTGGPDLNRAIRAGLGLATAGMLIPVYWMVTGTHPRTVTDANGADVPMYQGHGIGDPDGHGMFLTNWSVTGGDFRVPHFFALHGIQVLLLLTVALTAFSARHAWLRDERARARLMGSAALGYGGLVAVVTWQAARGQSLIHPDTATLTAFGAVLLLTAAATARLVVSARRAAVAS